MTDDTIVLFNFTVDYTYYKYSDLAKQSFWFLLFCLLWTAQWMVCMGQITLSVAFSTWYFSADKSNLPCSGIFSYLGTSLRYHT